MKRVAFFYYREWAADILDELVQQQQKRGDFEISAVVAPLKLKPKIKDLWNTIPTKFIDPADANAVRNVVLSCEAELVLFYGWSWMVPKDVVGQNICICLHPSKLPNFRGGSPIQNQVMEGVENSAVSVIRMNEQLDAGPIYQQHALSLVGSIDEILLRIASIGRSITVSLLEDFINDELIFHEQDEPSFAPVKRRHPCDGAIDIDQIAKVEFRQLARLILSLRDPYPNAYIELIGQNLLIQGVHKFKILPTDAFLLTSQNKQKINFEKRLFLTVLDGYALISDWSNAD